MADSRLLSEVPVGQKKATLVTSHPEGSYELVTDANKVVEKTDHHRSRAVLGVFENSDH